jgi:hypothetical protein
MKWIRNLFFANWRNKAVAMFFSLSIWFVAYQSETKKHPATLNVTFHPADAEKTVIMGLSVENKDAPGSVVAFGGDVRVLYSGPRKQIDKLKENLRLKRRWNLVIPAGAERYEFSPDDFGFDGVNIDSIEPAVVKVEKELLEELRVSLSKEHLVVSPMPADHEVVLERVDPETIALRGPESLLNELAVAVIVRYEGQPVDGPCRLEVRSRQPRDAARVNSLVEVLDPRDGTWVAAGNPVSVDVKLELRELEETFESEGVRVMFRFPVSDLYLQFSLDDLPGDTIPVAFSGPTEQIKRLKSAVRHPGFALVVPPPPNFANFDPKTGGTFTFTEDDLELRADASEAGYPGVVVKRHSSRRAPFSYRVKAAALDKSADES